MLQGLLYITLLLFSPDIFAGFFDPPPTDKSVNVLGLIFGANIGNVYLGGAANPTMSNIMEKFNFIMVAVGTIVVSYVAILSVINTAQEGEAMGKRWSAVWTPLRTVSGMVLLIPSPGTGYSFIQVMVTYVILQGIGAADQVWNLALDGLQKGSSVTMGKNVIPGVEILGIAYPIAADILQIAICLEGLNQIARTGDHALTNDWLNRNAAYMKHYTTSTNIDPRIIPSDPNSITSISVTGASNFGVEDPNNTNSMQTATCGSIEVSGTAYVADFGADYFNDMSASEKYRILLKKAQEIYDTKQLAISSMISILQPLAEAIVRNNVKPLVLTSYSQNIKRPPDTSTSLQPQGYKPAATQAYVDILSGLIRTADSSSLTNALRDAIRIGKTQGWVVAGSFYFVLNKNITPGFITDIYTAPEINTPVSCTGGCENLLYSTPPKFDLIETKNPTLTKLGLSNAEMQAMNTYLATGAIYWRNDSAVASNLNLATADDGDFGNQIIAAIAKPLNDLMLSFMQSLNGTTTGGDILLAQSQFGQTMMRAMEAAWLVTIAAVIVLALPAWIPFTAGYLGLYIGLLMTLLSMVIPVIALVWGIGASLAVYVPLIPFIIFTTATVGWLIAVIEAIIAAPLICIGLVMPSGDELGRLETALMILANVFLRPMLMILGFILASRIYSAAVYIVDKGMLEVLNTINVQTIFSSVLVFFIYASFIMGITNTCFSVIYGLPDKVLRWMGGGRPEATDMSAAQEAKRAIGAAAGEIGKGMADTGKMGTEKVSGMAKENAERWANMSGEAKASSSPSNPVRNFFKGRAEDRAAAKEAKEAKGAEASHSKMIDLTRGEDAARFHKEMAAKANTAASKASIPEAHKADMGKVFDEMKKRQNTDPEDHV
jgi:conjugal transfer/type IV secretion protein DotA/TraY